MPRINLLPWREEHRQKRQRDFLISLAAAFVAGVAAIALINLSYSNRIDHQSDRNEKIEAEIVKLQLAITEIDGLERQKERLLARMEIIEQLQRSRPEIVHLFDEMVRRLPEGVYLTGMKQTGARVEIKGVAQSSTRVSALMRLMDASEWMSDPDVVKVETTEVGPSRQAEFVVNIKQVGKTDDQGDEG
jgi:type IV pilus assembly protein PilN